MNRKLLISFSTSLKFIPIIIVILFIFSCAQEAEEKENNNDKDSIRQSVDNNIDTTELENNSKVGLYSYHTPNKLQYVHENDNNRLTDAFLPIGWSRDGKFAYINLPADEACNCFILELYIQDMKNNEILWHWDFNDNGQGKTLHTVWNVNKDLFSKHLLMHKIIQQDHFELLPVEFKINDREYMLTLKSKMKNEPVLKMDVVSEITFYLQKNNDRKKIRTIDFRSPSFILGTLLEGVIKSPYEDVIAIFCRKERRGYEGPPHVTEYLLTGHKLKKKMSL
jgi:hypothetical protein